jgi:hypothetical protein
MYDKWQFLFQECYRIQRYYQKRWNVIVAYTSENLDIEQHALLIRYRWQKDETK